MRPYSEISVGLAHCLQPVQTTEGTAAPPRAFLPLWTNPFLQQQPAESRTRREFPAGKRNRIPGRETNRPEETRSPKRFPKSLAPPQFEITRVPFVGAESS